MDPQVTCDMISLDCLYMTIDPVAGEAEIASSFSAHMIVGQMQVKLFGIVVYITATFPLAGVAFRFKLDSSFH